MARHTQSKWIVLGEINAAVRVLLGPAEGTDKDIVNVCVSLS